MSGNPDSLGRYRLERLTAHVSNRGWRTAAAAAFATFALLAAGLWASEHWAARWATRAADAQAREMARSNAFLFDSELEKFRLVPTLLSEYPDVSALLRSAAGDPLALNQRLEVLARRTGASAIYVIDARGRTVAASNYALPTSFVGQSYGFRPYFTEALATGASELFALGTVSGRPGLFIARRVGTASAPAGVVVTKIAFDRMEAAWGAQAGTTFVTDVHDVVIISSRPAWRFNRLRALRRAEQAEIARTRQFDDLPLRPLPVAFSGKAATSDGVAYRRADAGVALAGAKLVALAPLEPALAAARARARVVLLILAILLGGSAIWLWRQRERARMQHAAQRDLETKVQERTAELRQVNARLLTEGARRQQADERFRRSREELAQANRLATLGQVAAGVAHEINQPVAAIRAYSENAEKFLAAGAAAKVAGNLGQIVDLTQRISQITAELRSFSRRKTPDVGPVQLGDAIEGALLLVHHRITETQTRVLWDAADAERSVRGDRVRLEQVFVNLIQNALDASDTRPGGVLTIGIEPAADSVAVSFADDGTGVPAALRGRLFTPFATAREDGLGLGLAIARDILREFGGDLSLWSTGPTGSVFVARLIPA